MPERPFHCTPTEQNAHPLLMRVSWEAHFLFDRIQLETNWHHRVPVDPENPAFSLRSKVFTTERRQRAWSERKVVGCLNELLAVGAVSLSEQAGRCWLVISQELQYKKGENRAAAPEKAEEQELPMRADGTAELFVLPKTGPPLLGTKRECTEKRLDSRKSRIDNDSARPAAEQHQSPSIESDKFSVPIEELNATTLGRRVGVFLGASQWLREAAASGREWLRILREETAELEEVIDQAERCRVELPNGSTRAKFIIKRLGERRVRCRTGT